MTTHARLCPYVREILLLNGSAYRTSVCARTAADALVSVNYVLTVALGNATCGASINACAAANALIRNLKCHLTNLHICCHIYSIISAKKIKTILKKIIKI